ncbi:CocE/NonD family hydrolase [uncultured Cyclobacterium sp.]|uniref:CocE/NonD family hydrolase n=1 Tax=uncultured Cyclobacterium sp. TaxID=453820 RepID=UPI0030EDE1ED
MKRKKQTISQNSFILKLLFGKSQWLLALLWIVPIGMVNADDYPGSNSTILNEIKIERHQPVKMRDGVILYADIYRPAKEGKYPVILTRTPYGVQREGVHHERMTKFAQRGYVAIVQDVRGRYESEGVWDPFRDEANDGFDTIEWAAKLECSNGKVATQGGSYLGHNQWAAASQTPPSLKAIFPSVASTNVYANWITMGGAFRLSFNYGWGVVRMPNKIMLPQNWHTAAYTPEELKYENILYHLPLMDGDLVSAGKAVPFYRDWVTHESYDEYWKSVSDEERFSKITVPAYNTGGWFDIFVMGTINGYVGMKNNGGTPEARKGTKLLIGPWGHGPSTAFGDMEFTEDAYVDLFENELRYYDFYLKGIQNGLDKEKPVQIYYMGENKWRHEDDWPIPGTVYKELYLGGDAPANSVRGGGSLSFEKPSKAAQDHYAYDPEVPVPTYGGNNCCGTPTPSGPKDQRTLERRNDILVYTSEFLTDPVSIAGPVSMKLFAATDGLDTDWMIKLVDVYPDGSAYPISEGILRAKFRNGTDKLELLKPNKVYEYEITLTGTANVFLPGHRIRVDITSSNFPQFDRNPNTGAPLGTSTETRIAQQTIHHGGPKPSHIVLPVVSGF